jgi:hypothetical protein
MTPDPTKPLCCEYHKDGGLKTVPCPMPPAETGLFTPEIIDKLKRREAEMSAVGPSEELLGTCETDGCSHSGKHLFVRGECYCWNPEPAAPVSPPRPPKQPEIVKALWELLFACENQERITPFGGLLQRTMAESRQAMLRYAQTPPDYEPLAKKLSSQLKAMGADVHPSKLEMWLEREYPQGVMR